jgi:hypothetical protein
MYSILIINALVFHPEGRIWIEGVWEKGVVENI